MTRLVVNAEVSCCAPMRLASECFQAGAQAVLARVTVVDSRDHADAHIGHQSAAVRCSLSSFGGVSERFLWARSASRSATEQRSERGRVASL
jgi:hypothetical protein